MMTKLLVPNDTLPTNAEPRTLVVASCVRTAVRLLHTDRPPAKLQVGGLRPSAPDEATEAVLAFEDEVSIPEQI